MFNFNEYSSKKSELIQKMEETKSKFSQLDQIGIDIAEPIKKINSAIKIVQDNKISVVLVGAFSDGKTSVASGWINERLDNMKIASDESSDEILCYTPSSFPEGCQIVDTPGLFGDKIGADEDGTQILLSDITKKYISEANLILYVVAAKNPIKDSHKDCIRWILKDLNKLSSTVFVINRMDDVADLTDDDDFRRQSKIKTENLRGKLLECGIDQSEAESAKVTCISAAPNGQGIEKWNSHYDEYLRRSRLQYLEQYTNAILQSTRDELITKTGCDILNDEINKILECINEQERIIVDVIIPEKRESYKRNSNDLSALYKRILRSRKEMKDALKALNKKKINAIRSSTMDNYKDILEDEIGILPDKQGYILNDEINDIFMEYAEKFSGWAMELGTKFQTEYGKQDDTVKSLLSEGTKVASNSMKMAGKAGIGVFKDAIFAGRDLLGKIGIGIKFKPWQVTKMASFTSKALPVIGGAIDVVSNIVENVSEKKKNQKFEQSKDDIKDAINSTFYEVMTKLENDDDYINQFAPSYRILETQVKQDEKEIIDQEEKNRAFTQWKKDFDEDYCIM